MKFISWNVNGLRAIVKKGFDEIFATFDADAVCLQETKLQEGQISLAYPGYESYWSYAERKGYSGTVVFTRHRPQHDLHRLTAFDDLEGRVVALEYEKFWLVNVYTPNIQGGLARAPFRKQWDDAFLDFVKMLDQSKPVVMCGDFNVAHLDIDLRHPEREAGNAGFSDQERSCFSRLLDAGFVDTFRYLHPDAENAYTWWSYFNFSRHRNDGWRIDYFLVSERLKTQIRDAGILADIKGSDHAPVYLEIDV